MSVTADSFLLQSTCVVLEPFIPYHILFTLLLAYNLLNFYSTYCFSYTHIFKDTYLEMSVLEMNTLPQAFILDTCVLFCSYNQVYIFIPCDIQGTQILWETHTNWYRHSLRHMMLGMADLSQKHTCCYSHTFIGRHVQGNI